MCVIAGLILVITFLTAQIGVIWCSDVDFAVKVSVICGLVSTCVTFSLIFFIWATSNCFIIRKQIQEDADTNRMIDQFMDFKHGVYDRLKKEEMFNTQMQSSDEDDSGSQSASDADNEESPQKKKDL